MQQLRLKRALPGLHFKVHARQTAGPAVIQLQYGNLGILTQGCEVQTCEVDMQQLRLKQALDPPGSLEATAAAYLAASKAKFPRRPLGLEVAMIPVPRAGAPAAWNPVAELRNMNRKRCVWECTSVLVQSRCVWAGL